MNVNWQLREINLKIVYYGPALSGKTTNLEKIFAGVDPSRRSDLVSLKTHEDRTLFFDFLQLELGKVGTLTPKIHLYTVPGQPYYEESRRLVLRRTDGIVFVADSAAERLTHNVESWRKMCEHLASFDVALEQIPVVVQFNKQDLPTALPPEELKYLLAVNGYSTFCAIAIDDQGVSETFKEITREVFNQLMMELS